MKFICNVIVSKEVRVSNGDLELDPISHYVILQYTIQ